MEVAGESILQVAGDAMGTVLLLLLLVVGIYTEGWMVAEGWVLSMCVCILGEVVEWGNPAPQSCFPHMTWHAQAVFN